MVLFTACADLRAMLPVLQGGSRSEVREAAVAAFPLLLFNLGPNFSHLIKQCLQWVNYSVTSFESISSKITVISGSGCKWIFSVWKLRLVCILFSCLFVVEIMMPVAGTFA